MTKIITVHNHKGGSGKTMISVNLAATLASMRNKVLLIDNDSQCNCSARVGFYRSEENIEQMYRGIGEIPVFPVDVTRCPNLFISPGSRSLNKLDREMHCNGVRNQVLLRNALEKIKNKFDYIVIDTPPDALSMLVFNSFTASDWVLIPIDSDGPSSLENLDTVFESVSEARVTNAKLDILGIVQNKDDNDSSAREVELQLNGYLGKAQARLKFKTSIRNFKNLKRAQWHDTPVIFHAPGSEASDNFVTFTKEVLKRMGK